MKIHSAVVVGAEAEWTNLHVLYEWLCFYIMCTHENMFIFLRLKCSRAKTSLYLICVAFLFWSLTMHVNL